MEDAAGEPSKIDGKQIVADDGVAKTAPSEVAKEGAETVDDSDQALTEEDRSVLEMIAQMNDEAEANSAAGAEEGAEQEGVLEQIANRDNREEAEPETAGILEQVADRENERGGADRVPSNR